jgi:ribosomal protein S8
MIRSQLRIYSGPEQLSVATADRKNTVTVPASEVLSTLADAIQQNRAWLDDFKDDEMTISTDLYEVILAYQHYHRPSAG